MYNSSQRLQFGLLLTSPYFNAKMAVKNRMWFNWRKKRMRHVTGVSKTETKFSVYADAFSPTSTTSDILNLVQISKRLLETRSSDGSHNLAAVGV
jgi:hypothetical protein